MSESAPIDHAALDALASGLPGGSLEDVLVTFAADLARRRRAVSVALASGDLGTLRALAHAIAGSAATFCAGPLAQGAARVERLAAAGDWEAAAAAGAGLVAEAERVVAELHERGRRREAPCP